MYLADTTHENCAHVTTRHENVMKQQTKKQKQEPNKLLIEHIRSEVIRYQAKIEIVKNTNSMQQVSDINGRTTHYTTAYMKKRSVAQVAHTTTLR